MLTEEEKMFMVYWEENRDKQRKFFRQLRIGLPAGTLLVMAIFISFISGWHKQAAMDFSQDRSVVITLLVAAAGIVIFVSVFTVKHKWDINEQRYLELRKKQKDNSSERNA